MTRRIWDSIKSSDGLSTATHNIKTQLQIDQLENRDQPGSITAASIRSLPQWVASR